MDVDIEQKNKCYIYQVNDWLIDIQLINNWLIKAEKLICY